MIGNNMIIALDFDMTYTKDPELWNEFIDNAQSRGHEVLCVTMRYEYEGDLVEQTIGKKCKVIYTGRIAKLNKLNELNIKIDIWIDDNPLWIYNNG
jgi:hypothetical protein